MNHNKLERIDWNETMTVVMSWVDDPGDPDDPDLSFQDDCSGGHFHPVFFDGACLHHPPLLLRSLIGRWAHPPVRKWHTGRNICPPEPILRQSRSSWTHRVCQCVSVCDVSVCRCVLCSCGHWHCSGHVTWLASDQWGQSRGKHP